VRTDDAPRATGAEPEHTGRRRGIAGMAATAGAVAAAIAGSALLFSPDRAAGPTSAADVPDGRRLVGIRQAAIAVPEVWATNAHACGTPQKDTVIIDLASVCLAGVGRPADVESVEVRQGEPRWADDVVVSNVEIAGEPARRTATTCSSAYTQTFCWAAVYLPGHDVEFRAESSTGAAEVDEILTWIRVVEDRVAVPGHRTISEREQENGGVAYLEALREAGLAPELVTTKIAGLRAGFLVHAVPAPGTMLEPGETVTVTVIAPPDGPADEIRVGVGFRTADGPSSPFLEDEEIRAGATLHLVVGDSLWAFGSGRRRATLAGQLKGGSLVPSESRANPGRAWKAVRPGTTTVTLTITGEDGKPVPLGTVTVVAS
jgi:hypothetical protein